MPEVEQPETSRKPFEAPMGQPETAGKEPSEAQVFGSPGVFGSAGAPMRP